MMHETHTAPARPVALTALAAAVALVASLFAPVASTASGHAESVVTELSRLAWQSSDTRLHEGPLPDGFVDPALEQIRATDAWASGVTGAGAIVAVIDTGVAPVEALQGRVVGEINFTDAPGGDGYGHGTYMASLVAGAGSVAPGVAPGAGILSLKVADAEGRTHLGAVLDALQWLAGPGRSLGIRVATLAVGVDPATPAGQVLDAATAAVTAGGTLVITATGNDENHRALVSPATSPGTLSAGALDGDEVASFSAFGEDRAGVSQPDVLLPGTDVYGHVDPTSVIAAQATDGADTEALERLSEGHVRGTGTSAAAALAAGVAALASSANPALDGLELASALGSGSGGRHLDAIEALEAVAGLETERPQASRLPNGRARSLHPHTPPEDTPLAPTASWTAAEWSEDAWRSGEWTTERWSDDVWGMGGVAVSTSTAKWYTAKWYSDLWNTAKWYGDDWNTAKWYTAKWYSDSWSTAKWYTAKWYTAKWYSEDWATAKWYTAKWYGEDWATAKWYADAWSMKLG